MLVFTLFLDNNFLGVFSLRQTALDVAVAYTDARFFHSKLRGTRKIKVGAAFHGAGCTTELFTVIPAPLNAGTFMLVTSKLDEFVRLT